jgi:hypothetical protein
MNNPVKLQILFSANAEGNLFKPVHFADFRGWQHKISFFQPNLPWDNTRTDVTTHNFGGGTHG